MDPSLAMPRQATNAAVRTADRLARSRPTVSVMGRVAPGARRFRDGSLCAGPHSIAYAIIARLFGRASALRKADSQFFDSFMLVIGILMGAAVGLFFLVRAIAIDTQGQYLKSDPEVLAEVSKRLEPVGHVMKLGDAELAAAAAAVSAPKPVAAPMTGPQVYNAVCVVCHAPPGNAGAPPTGDVEAWGPRIAKGNDTLHTHAIEGFKGDKGFMPPKGGRVDLSDAEISSAVDYIVSQAKK